uniref:Uncharacterized protein n=1 Tax=viral metagenome TaxID=1070528 RepID=A0A6H1Z8E7_9ZZZZ
MRAIVRVSPRGDLTCHQAGSKPFPDWKEKWQVLMTWNDGKRNIPIERLRDYAYSRLIKMYGL